MRGRFTKIGKGDEYIFKYNESDLSPEVLQEFSSSYIRKINSNENLNIDSELDMAAKILARRIRDQAQDLVKQSLLELRNLDHSQLIEEYKERAEEMIQAAISHIDEKKRPKYGAIYENEKTSLLSYIHESLLQISRSELERICRTISDEFKSNLAEHSKSCDKMEDFGIHLSEKFQNKVEKYVTSSEKLVLEHDQWRKLVNTKKQNLMSELAAIGNTYEMDASI